jgi:hypothetical protein
LDLLLLPGRHSSYLPFLPPDLCAFFLRPAPHDAGLQDPSLSYVFSNELINNQEAFQSQQEVLSSAICLRAFRAAPIFPMNARKVRDSCKSARRREDQKAGQATPGKYRQDSAAN